MAKAVQSFSRSVGISRYMVQARAARKKVDWRDYVIPTKNKKKRRISEMVDKIVYGA